MAKKTYYLVEGPDLSREFLPSILSVQGLLNREGPEVYVATEERRPVERNWIEWYKAYGLQPLRVGADALLARGAEVARGAVVYDPDRPHSVNLAIVLAGLEDRIAIPVGFEGRLQAMGIEDIARPAVEVREPLAAYRWAVSQLLERANRAILGSFEVDAWSLSAPVMDLLVAERGFAMGISMYAPDRPDEAALWEQVLRAAPPGATLLGWHTEIDAEPNFVTVASRHGVRVVDGQPYNLSFHRHVAARGTPRLDHPEPGAIEIDGQGAYVTLILAPGETLQAVTDIQKGFWRSPRRGEVPLGWVVSPSLERFAPAILEYYAETKSPADALVAGPSGVARAYLSALADPDRFLEETREAMARADLRVLAVLNRSVEARPGLKLEHRLRDGKRVYSKEDLETSGGEKDEVGTDYLDLEVAARYVRAVPEAIGFFQGWEPIPDTPPFLVEGKPWAPVRVLVGGDAKAESERFERIAARAGRPLFIVAHVDPYESDMETVVLLSRALEGRGFRVVRPDAFLVIAGQLLAAEAHAAERIAVERVLHGGFSPDAEGEGAPTRGEGGEAEAGEGADAPAAP